MSNSKPLSKSDESGDALSHDIFNPALFSTLDVSMDRIQKFYKGKNCYWIMVNHILLEENQPYLASIDDLTFQQNKEFQKNLDFLDFFQQKQLGKNGITGCRLLVNLYYPIGAKNENTVFKIKAITKNQFQLKQSTLEELASTFRTINFFGDESHKYDNYSSPKLETNQIKKERADNSAFSFSKSLLSGDKTYAINVDKIIYNPTQKNYFLFEYLLCEESQKVTPHSSHPNRYFQKNSQKFLGLFELSQALDSPLILLNYAKPNTEHHDQFLWMDCLDVKSNANDSQWVVTKNEKLNKEQIIQKIQKEFETELSPLLDTQSFPTLDSKAFFTKNKTKY